MKHRFVLISSTIRKVAFLFCAMFFFSTINAQVVKQETNSELNLKSVKGTFQIEYLLTEGNPISLTTEFLSLVEKSRKEDEVVYLKIDDKTRIKVYSKSEINSGKHIGIPEYVVVQSFN